MYGPNGADPQDLALTLTVKGQLCTPPTSWTQLFFRGAREVLEGAQYSAIKLSTYFYIESNTTLK